MKWGVSGNEVLTVSRGSRKSNDNFFEEWMLPVVSLENDTKALVTANARYCTGSPLTCSEVTGVRTCIQHDRVDKSACYGFLLFADVFEPHRATRPRRSGTATLRQLLAGPFALFQLTGLDRKVARRGGLVHRLLCFARICRLCLKIP